MAHESGGNGFSWFLAGLGIGSLLGVLYAPKAGYETREELVNSAIGSSEYIKQRSREAGRSAGEYVDRGRAQVGDLVSRGRGQVDTYVDRSKGAVEQGRQKINEAYNQGRQVVADQKDRISAAYEAGKDAYQNTAAFPVANEDLIPSTTEHLS